MQHSEKSKTGVTKTGWEKKILTAKTLRIKVKNYVFNQFLSSFTHLQFVSNLYEFLSLKEDILKNAGYKTVAGSHWLP